MIQSINMTTTTQSSVLQSRRSLYIGNLPETLTEPTLRATLIPFGPIQSIDLPMDYIQGTIKGFAFVEFQDGDDAMEALYNLDGSELLGRVLSVSFAKDNYGTKLGGNKAVWTQDEWFQQQQQPEQQQESGVTTTSSDAKDSQ